MSDKLGLEWGAQCRRWGDSLAMPARLPVSFPSVQFPRMAGAESGHFQQSGNRTRLMEDAGKAEIPAGGSRKGKDLPESCREAG